MNQAPEEKNLRSRIRRRLSATKRIGCAYRLTGIDMAEGFDSAAWLPGDVMARFFAGIGMVGGAHPTRNPQPDSHRASLQLNCALGKTRDMGGRPARLHDAAAVA
jgi:hypothetical protein